MREKQREAALAAMTKWLFDPAELGKAPSKIQCAAEFDLHDLHYYVFKFKKGILGDWLVGVCGGYEGEETEHCGHVFSNMTKYDEKTAIDDCKAIVEEIRAYWMKSAKEHEKLQKIFEANLKYISATELDPKTIENQFVKTESRFFLTVGEVDCPTGRIVVSDPLCYLAAGKFCPELELAVAPGTYPVEVSICRNPYAGIRMCTARLKIKDTKAVRYELAKPTEETAAAKGVDGLLTGFPVDAGMMSFCDAGEAKVYYDFIGKWHEYNPDGNHYDDYFASYLAESYQKLPAYQREGGDFTEWTDPDSGNRLVMVASGFGDGFYQSYWGYDVDGEICELAVPMVNPDLFEE